MIRVELEGAKALRAALEAAPAKVRDAVGDVVLETAVNIEAEVKLRIHQGPATGRVYKRGNVLHQASAPGQAPMSDTGTLAGSVYHEREGELSAIAGSRMAYAAYLEFGTTHMAPRPVWTPVAHEAEAEFRQRVETALGVAL